MPSDIMVNIDTSDIYCLLFYRSAHAIILEHTLVKYYDRPQACATAIHDIYNDGGSMKQWWRASSKL